MLAALAASASMIGFQTAAKATRDALFLSTFDVSALPTMVIGAALISVLLAFSFARLMPVVGPTRLVAATFAASALLIVAEWMALRWVREPVVVLFYFHYAGLGALLISGFWSVVSEQYDPRGAKRAFGRIGAAGTIGGLAGGVLAERMAVLVTVEAMLPLLAALHALCALLITASGLRQGPLPSRKGDPALSVVDEAGGLPSGIRTIAQRPYLRSLVVLVLIAAVAEMFIDYVFKARASAAAADKESLLRFFAIVYTCIGLGTVIVQAAGTRIALQRFGLARTASLLPAVMVAGGAAALAFPGLASATGARAGEIVTRNSLYRAAYEVLFTPLSPRDRRATKSLIDVGVVRLGDVVGGVLVQGILLMAANEALPVLLALAVACSVAGVWVALRLHRGYVQSLERSLLSQAVRLDLSEITDLTTRTAMLETLGTLDLSALRAPEVVSPRHPSGEQGPEPAGPSAEATDKDARRFGELRSRDPVRVRAALHDGPLPEPLVPTAIGLLAWNTVATDAIAALRSVAENHVGQLEDHLLDAMEEFTVRRRIPLVLVGAASQRSVGALVGGLADSRFEVRYRCGRALNRLSEQAPGVRIDPTQILAAVLREVAVDKGVWESRRLLDALGDDEWSPVVDEAIRERADRSLEHVFTLLALVLPKHPLKVAFRSLHTDDRRLRGTALEYLETALPDDVRAALWPFLDDHRSERHARRPSAEIVNELLGSNESIALNLERLRRRREPDET